MAEMQVLLNDSEREPRRTGDLKELRDLLLKPSDSAMAHLELGVLLGLPDRQHPRRELLRLLDHEELKLRLFPFEKMQSDSSGIHNAKCIFSSTCFAKYYISHCVTTTELQLAFTRIRQNPVRCYGYNITQ